MQEVVKKEIVKLLDTSIIYPIADSPWVSPIHCVPKKGGIIVVTNQNDELVSTRTVTDWRVCIDYRKLNEATAKDHFPLPFMDQIYSEVDDNFPGETLMEINTKDEPWFADFANYLVGDIIPKGTTYQQKNKFFSNLKRYFWEEPYLFKVRSDGNGYSEKDKNKGKADKTKHGNEKSVKDRSRRLHQAPPYQAPAPQTQGVTKNDFESYVKANDAVMRNMQEQNQNLQNQMTNLMDMLSKFVNSNNASTSGSWTFPSNTITNPKVDLKGITTRSGVAYQGPMIPTTTSSPPKVMEREFEVTKDTVLPTNNGSTKDV
ncbi:hypothetical protein Tco_1112099 [Tanacetum coccineum]|uniref:Reverse transcriptase domain-containing protein n=1 Tax=Tanacetum coccineum TaxID=301880 RepID=A0ABQ5IPQ0_9ASTR